MKRWLMTFVGLALMTPAGWCFGIDMTAGLNITVDRIPEPVEVDGIAMTVQRATGTDILKLARRLEASWRAQGSEVRALQQRDWTLVSRLSGSRSEVIQWRVSPATPELLWSSFDMAATARSIPDAGISLPTGCAWGRSVSGSGRQQRYLQRSARCTQSGSVLSRQLCRSLPHLGWRIVNATDESLLVEQKGMQGLVSLTVHPGEQGTWLTWLRVEQ
jgi:hypothetical protein